ncbi:hypothetical protein RYD26_10765 [Pasteurellaceae bacterium LIM206]|nr:hypothetical protein [Pasteurellaceae bacterium LIM206]
MQKSPTIIFILLAVAVFGYGVYNYYEISAFDASRELSIGALTHIFYELGNANGVLIGYSLIALFFLWQAVRNYKNSKK